MNMGNAKTVLAFASLAGMESTVLWRVARTVAPVMVNAVLMLMVLGNVGVKAVGMEKIVACSSNKAAVIAETMIKVSDLVPLVSYFLK